MQHAMAHNQPAMATTVAVKNIELATSKALASVRPYDVTSLSLNENSVTTTIHSLIQNTLLERPPRGGPHDERHAHAQRRRAAAAARRRRRSTKIVDESGAINSEQQSLAIALGKKTWGALCMVGPAPPKALSSKLGRTTEASGTVTMSGGPRSSCSRRSRRRLCSAPWNRK